MTCRHGLEVVKPVGNPYYCWVCGSSEYLQYMVKEDIWKAYGIGKGILYIPCLETRMKRRLNFSDFDLDMNIMEMMHFTMEMIGVPKRVLQDTNLHIRVNWDNECEHGFGIYKL